ncbi:U6 snRNA phosphodiesterase 1 isoform X1 [Cloeon dipterum]|uniref:U6 snRNA phosphodiesterase 1 isoform X1 n=2 Tax=Cloeon dipterum TaxID=197152 RepID=UPI0032208D0B
MYISTYSKPKKMDLLKCYESSSGSESEDGTPLKVEPVKFVKLEVPSSIIALFPGNDENAHQDDPSMHQGRVRSFAHERGMWAGLVSIEIGQPISGWTRLLDSLEGVNRCTPPLHVSLSRPLQLRHIWIAPLLADLRKRAAQLKQFEIMFGGVAVFVNDEQTRTFISVEAIGGGLEAACSLAEAAGAEYRLPPYYESRHFHVSIGWALGDQETRLKTALTQQPSPPPASFPVTQLQLKTGHQIHQVPLQRV